MMVTIQEAKTFLRDNFKKGTNCPCCGQRVQLYNRKVHAQTAVDFLKLVRMYLKEPRFYHINEIGPINGGGDFAKLRYFKLIEYQENNDTSKRTSGLWRPTDFGLAVARRERSFPKYAYVFDSKVEYYSDDRVMITDSLGKKFNYDELMRGEP